MLTVHIFSELIYSLILEADLFFAPSLFIYICALNDVQVHRFKKIYDQELHRYKQHKQQHPPPPPLQQLYCTGVRPFAL